MNELGDAQMDSFSLRKIPINKNREEQVSNDKIYDKVKIIELSNSIDKWEEELLLSDDGFFSLKGQEVEGKTKEFYKDLNEFISRKISELKFSEPSSNKIVLDVKNKKLAIIKNKMQRYEIEQLRVWEIDVYEEALSFSIKKAIFYKNNEEMIRLSLKNAFEILKVMSEKENWSQKTFKKRVEVFEERFYLSLINAFFVEKDIKAETIFEKVKDKISQNEREKLENSLKKLKQQVIAFNFSQELFSYDLSKEEAEKEIKKIEDSDIEKLVRKFLRDFEDDKKKNKEKIDEEKNERNWLEVIAKLKEDSPRAFLYIDTTLSKESQKAKREYIEQISKSGFIHTDKKVFNSLFDDFIEDLDIFKNKNISDFRATLSGDDFALFSKFKEISMEEYILLSSDYKFLKDKLMDKQKNDDSKYNIIQVLLSSINSYISINKKEPDVEKRNKLIEAILERNLRKD